MCTMCTLSANTRLLCINAIECTNLPERISLVVVEPALHAHDGHALEVAEDHLADVALDRGRGEVRDLFVGEALLLAERVDDWACSKSDNAIVEYIGFILKC